ncbi:MAG: hypothetical protein HWE30_02350 [Methylocystaceae bacterium]|nr:hypothetical protein [Methylocystaceae bacterium]
MKIYALVIGSLLFALLISWGAEYKDEYLCRVIGGCWNYECKMCETPEQQSRAVKKLILQFED